MTLMVQQQDGIFSPFCVKKCQSQWASSIKAQKGLQLHVDFKIVFPNSLVKCRRLHLSRGRKFCESYVFSPAVRGRTKAIIRIPNNTNSCCYHWLERGVSAYRPVQFYLPVSYTDTLWGASDLSTAISHNSLLSDCRFEEWRISTRKRLISLLKGQIAHSKLEILSSGKHYCYTNMTHMPRALLKLPCLLDKFLSPGIRQL